MKHQPKKITKVHHATLADNAVNGSEWGILKSRNNIIPAFTNMKELKKNRMKYHVLHFENIIKAFVLTLIFFSFPGYERNAFAIQGYQQDDGTCIAYYYKKHVGYKTFIDGYMWSYGGRSNGIPKKIIGAHITNTSFPRYCRTNIGLLLDWYKWNGVGWSKMGYFHWLGQVELLPQSCASVTTWPQSDSIYNDMASLGVPENTTPAEYWPDGPPADCGIPCLEEKQAKIAECGGADLVDWETWSEQTCEGGQCTAKEENGYGPPSCENR